MSPSSLAPLRARGARTAALLLAPWLAWAAPGLLVAPTPARAESAAAVQVEGALVGAELRAEYLVGEQVLVPVTVSNPGAAPLTFPDLTARPWLVRFELVDPAGGALRRSTAPPAQDDGRMVTVAVRGHRRTLLEVPGGGATRAGSYQLAVQLVQGEKISELSRQAVRFVPPKVAAVDLGPDPIAGSKAGVRAVWVHQAETGADLYLHRARTEDPLAGGTNRHLVHLDGVVQPWLAAARSGDAQSSVVAWSAGPRAMRVIEVDPTGRIAGDHSVGFPWPAAEIIGRPGVAAGGVVGVPLWIADPDGQGGELRVAVVGPGDHVGFAGVSRFPTRPAAVRTMVDASGAAQFLVQHAAGLDLYALRASTAPGAETLPLVGRRLLASQAGTTLLSARFGVVPQSEGHAGGVAIYTLQQDAAGLAGQWLDLRGNRITSTASVAAPAGAEVVATLPSAAGGLGLLLRQGKTYTWLEGERRLALGELSGPIDLLRDGQGRPVLRGSAAASPVTARSLAP